MNRNSKPDRTSAGLEQAARTADDSRYILRLYVAGLTSRSVASIESVKQVCEDQLKGRYELRIVDIYKDPALAKSEQIIAAPTLIKKLPLPLRRLIGSMADKKKVILGLDLREKDNVE